MKKELTCGDCRHSFQVYGNKGGCIMRECVELNLDGDICPDFVGEDGSRPRFCRLASSVDEMAGALANCVEEGINTMLISLGNNPLTNEEIEVAHKRAVQNVKAWLMEVEDER